MCVCVWEERGLTANMKKKKKKPNARKYWGQKKGIAKDEMVR